MSIRHCPLCDAQKIIALGTVAYSNHVAVEHKCIHCGHLFYIDDRRQAQRSLNDESHNMGWLARVKSYRTRI